jgi:uncharacterized protein YbjT (DUF2867 family)
MVLTAMQHSSYHKPALKSIAIFGASGHIGGPMARYTRYHAPQVRLRLIGSNPDKAEQLRADFPGAEVAVANYRDPASLEAALAGIEGLMVLTTQPMDERQAMTNLVSAVRKCGALRHMIRVVGMFPDFNPRRIPQRLREFGMGLEIQHPIARQVLEEADMPVTFLNVGASYMDNFLRMIPGLQESGTLVWPNRVLPYIDPRELGEVAARLLLSDDSRHVGQFYTVNNGEPGISTEEVAALMSEVFQRPIVHDGSREAFMKFFAPLMEAGIVPAELPAYLWDFFRFEDDNAPAWVANHFVERTLGRKPTTVRAWLQEHKQLFFDDTATAVRLTGAHAPAAAAPPAATANLIDGTWDCTVATPAGKEPHVLVMRTTPDGGLTGEMTNTKNGIVMPLQNGTCRGNTLNWALQLQKPLKLNLKVEVTVSGHQLTGHAKAGLIGKAAIQGTRRGA